MSTLFAIALVFHVIFGVVGVIASYTVLLLLLKKTANQRVLKWASFIAFLSYMVSWFSGGYYYVLYYGGSVKPDIVGGASPWAHLVFMEAKEHIFLMLPFATFALFILLYFKADAVFVGGALKGNTILLSAVITVLATIITLSGILISGGAR